MYIGPRYTGAIYLLHVCSIQVERGIPSVNAKKKYRYLYVICIIVCVCVSDQTKFELAVINGSKSTVHGALRVNISKRSVWLTVIFIMHPPNLQTDVYVLQIYNRC